jgi:hypothetical protein
LIGREKGIYLGYAEGSVEKEKEASQAQVPPSHPHSQMEGWRWRGEGQICLRVVLPLLQNYDFRRCSEPGTGKGNKMGGGLAFTSLACGHGDGSSKYFCKCKPLQVSSALFSGTSISIGSIPESPAEMPSHLHRSRPIQLLYLVSIIITI